MLSPAREARYPLIQQQGYCVSSEETPKYNCVALAAGDFTNWWEPSTVNSRIVTKPGRFWVDGVPADGSIESYVRLFESLGYRECEGAKLEILYEKIAIYGFPEGDFSHVAYQLFLGWISKLGAWEDIHHRSLNALEGEYYGHTKVIMKRKCNLRGFLLRVMFNQVIQRWPSTEMLKNPVRGN